MPIRKIDALKKIINGELIAILISVFNAEKKNGINKIKKIIKQYRGTNRYVELNKTTKSDIQKININKNFSFIKGELKLSLNIFPLNFLCKKALQYPLINFVL